MSVYTGLYSVSPRARCWALSFKDSRKFLMRPWPSRSRVMYLEGSHVTAETDGVLGAIVKDKDDRRGSREGEQHSSRMTIERN